MTVEKFHQVAISVPTSVIDANGHVNNVEYLRWMQDAAVSHADTAGCTAATREIGATWIARSHHLEYLRPAYAGEKLMILTWVSTMQRASSLRKYVVIRESDHTVLMQGETNWVLIDVLRGRPRSVTPAIAEKFTVIALKEELALLAQACPEVFPPRRMRSSS